MYGHRHRRSLRYRSRSCKPECRYRSCSHSLRGGLPVASIPWSARSRYRWAGGCGLQRPRMHSRRWRLGPSLVSCLVSRARPHPHPHPPLALALCPSVPASGTSTSCAAVSLSLCLLLRCGVGGSWLAGTTRWPEQGEAQVWVQKLQGRGRRLWRLVGHCARRWYLVWCLGRVRTRPVPACASVPASGILCATVHLMHRRTRLSLRFYPKPVDLHNQI